MQHTYVTLKLHTWSGERLPVDLLVTLIRGARNEFILNLMQCALLEKQKTILISLQVSVFDESMYVHTCHHVLAPLWKYSSQCSTQCILTYVQMNGNHTYVRTYAHDILHVTGQWSCCTSTGTHVYVHIRIYIEAYKSSILRFHFSHFYERSSLCWLLVPSPSQRPPPSVCPPMQLQLLATLLSPLQHVPD